jgi:glycosyltransferase involved in cell wall biosynthesis
MVIAHVLSSFHVGGQERVALDLAIGQKARGHRLLAVSLAAPPEGPLGEMFRREGIAAHTVVKRGPTLDPSLPLRLGSLLRYEGVQVVHTHNPQPLIYAGLAARLAGSAVVQTRHGVAFYSGRQAWLTRQVARLADAYVMVSRELQETLRPQALCPPERMSVIENGIDLARFYPDGKDRQEVRAELGIPADAQVIGTVCRLIESKNTAGLIRSSLPLLNEKIRLLVVGDGPERGALEAQVLADPRGRFVHLVGQRNDVARLLRGFDLFALFSRTEGHPLVVLEAMASALPIVATSVGGLPSIVSEGVTGFLVPSDDEAALRGLLGQVLADPKKLIEAGDRARAVALERYSSDRMVDEYLALYARCGRREAACSPSL